MALVEREGHARVGPSQNPTRKVASCRSTAGEAVGTAQVLRTQVMSAILGRKLPQT